ncbi:SGNH/GDSL hydrolase family protein [Acetobacter suratthaniensis]|uniref:SGNH/GDSL hydrolase family protein n=1 Tax=Acetobacter suratthaniensis TaxID=1502841 RepID=A0ABS3LNK6_9PROT|nr:SGNH/GDSL hydrolase family protein [Acetobacter suratthaniensis]MBO1328935.1 SGNH/GDSL hydrolase family protein [Acetobacter suratthaniensis]MCX2567147.1 SGNH/GDSL hydrolase family protein [Acetobacter suratthaniensis]
MRRVISRLCMVAGLAPLLLQAQLRAAEVPFKALYVFGDSYSDNGAARAVSTEAVKAKMPQATVLPAEESAGLYWNGRWSNGPTAVEDLAHALGATMTNVAVGGARCGSGNYYTWLDGWRDTGLRGQVLSFVAQGRKLDASALYVLGASANDFFLHTDMASPKALADIAQSCAQDMKDAVQILHDHGARNFLILGAYNLARVPAVAQEPHAAAQARLFEADYDRKTRQALASVATETGVNLIWFPWSAVTETLLANAQANHLTDTVHPCQPTLPAPGKACATPDAAFWWDEYHPTKQAHALIAQQMLEVVRKNISEK